MPGPLEKTHYELTVPFPVDVVLGALVDFSDRRPRIWPETSHPAVYRVHRLSQTQAEITEGIPFTWSRERYDWSEPGLVTLTQLDGNVAKDGRIRYRLEPVSGETHVVCDRYRLFFGWRGRLAGTVMVLVGKPMLRRQLRLGIERFSANRAP